MIGNAPDEEHIDQHGECAAEIKRLKQHIHGLEVQVQTMSAIGASRERQFTKARYARDALKATLLQLATATKTYRTFHDLHGDGSKTAGRAWDLMKRAEQEAEQLLLGIDHSETCGFALYGPPALCTCK